MSELLGKITVRRVGRRFAVGRLRGTHWQILRCHCDTSVGSLAMQLIYGRRAKALKVAKHVRIKERAIRTSYERHVARLRTHNKSCTPSLQS